MLTKKRESVITVVGPGDSLVLTDSTLIHWPSDSVGLREPSQYNRCLYDLVEDTIFKLRSEPFDSTLKIISSHDSILVRKGFNKIIILTADYNSVDTIRGVFVSPNNTFLKRLSLESIQPVSYTFNDSLYVTRVIDSFYLRDELYFDTSLIFISENKVESLSLDSAVHYDDNIFAETGASHMNGQLDISFSGANQTEFKEDTINITLDPKTGDTLYSVDSSGSWTPKRQSCWHFSIWTARCHIGLRSETFWYPPISKTSYNLAGPPPAPIVGKKANEANP